MYTNNNNDNSNASSSSSSATQAQSVLATQSPLTYQKELYKRGLPQGSPALDPVIIYPIIFRSILRANGVEATPKLCPDLSIGLGKMAVSVKYLSDWVVAFIHRNNGYNEISTGSLQLALSIYDRLCNFKNALGEKLQGNALMTAQRKLFTMQVSYFPHEIFSVCALIAYKHTEDLLLDNYTMAQIMMVKLDRLNALEIDVLSTINFEVGFRKADFIIEKTPGGDATIKVSYSVVPIFEQEPIKNTLK